jgi:hypothetical protein
MVSLVWDSFLVEIVLDVNPLIVTDWSSWLLSWLLELHGHLPLLEVSLLHRHAIDIRVWMYLLLLETQLFLELSDKESLSLLVQLEHLRVTAHLHLLLWLYHLRWRLHLRKESAWRVLGLVVLLLIALIIGFHLLVRKVGNRSVLFESYLLLPLFLEHHIHVRLSLVISSG